MKLIVDLGEDVVTQENLIRIDAMMMSKKLLTNLSLIAFRLLFP